MPAPSPITIRGVTYPSMIAAAEALGITTVTLRRLRRAGKVDLAGLKDKPGYHDGSPEPVTIRGETFPSMTAAAEVYGVDVSAISLAKKRGTLDSVGLRGALT